jgi:predicted  nucleic acid-binding Zn-ribbon protein
MERKLEATQETIIDQQQTIEKFRDLVHNLNADLAEYRSKGERSGGGTGDTQSQAAVMNLNMQLKSASMTQARVRRRGGVRGWGKEGCG